MSEIGCSSVLYNHVLECARIYRYVSVRHFVNV